MTKKASTSLPAQPASEPSRAFFEVKKLPFGKQRANPTKEVRDASQPQEQ